MPFHDLNISSEINDAELSNILAFSQELGYTCVALSLSVLGKLPSQIPEIDTKGINVPSGVKLLKRMNLTIADTSSNHRISQLISAYDLLALRPTNEKAFQLCCSSLDCDIISLDFNVRVSYPIKFKTVASALQRGVRFEICYSGGITGGNDARRNLINGAASLIRATRGRGIIVSSEARSALGLRAPFDVVNLATVWGLTTERAKEAVCEEVALVVKLAGIKRSSFRGVVDIVNDGSKEITQNTDSGTKEAQDTVAAASPGADEASTPDPQPLNLVTAVPEKPGKSDKAKRKASQASLNAPDANKKPEKEEKPMSKREQKRQAKKARLDRHQGEDLPSSSKEVGFKSDGFLIQHEALLRQKKNG